MCGQWRHWLGPGQAIRQRRISWRPNSTRPSCWTRWSRGINEWMRTGKAKQPYCFEIGEGELFAFAGLWDRWKDAGGNTVATCSILTTTPNAVASAVPDRIPVILDPDAYDLWLDPGMTDVVEVSNLLKPFYAGLMRSYPVSTRINSVANDDAECSAPVELAQIQNRLFL